MQGDLNKAFYPDAWENDTHDEAMYEDCGIDEIGTIHRKYGDAAFRMGLTHLFSVGCEHVTRDSVEKTKQIIIDEVELEHGIPIMSKEFRCLLLDLALELNAHEIWDLLCYVKVKIDIG